VPTDLSELAKEYREKMLEAVAEHDEQVLERYLNGQSHTEEDIKRAIRAGTIALKVTPVLCGAAFKNKGVQQLLDGVVDFLPSPRDVPPVDGIDPVTGKEVTRRASDDEPFSALVFKIITHPFAGQLTYCRVYSCTPKTATSIYKLSTGTAGPSSPLL